MARHYGPAAMQWFFRALGKTHCDREMGRNSAPGTLWHRFAFIPSERPHQASNTGFPDAGILPLESEVQIRTYLSIDPPLITRCLALLLRAGLGSLITRHAKRVSQRIPAFDPSTDNHKAPARLVSQLVSADLISEKFDPIFNSRLKNRWMGASDGGRTFLLRPCGRAGCVVSSGVVGYDNGPYLRAGAAYVLRGTGLRAPFFITFETAFVCTAESIHC